jgi:hypothetical protein
MFVCLGIEKPEKPDNGIRKVFVLAGGNLRKILLLDIFELALKNAVLEPLPQYPLLSESDHGSTYEAARFIFKQRYCIRSGSFMCISAILSISALIYLLLYTILAKCYTTLNVNPFRTFLLNKFDMTIRVDRF